MKKRIYLLATFLALVVPLFSPSKSTHAFAAANLGTIKVGTHEKTFTSSAGLVSTMVNLMSNECKSDYSNKDVVLTLYADVTDSDFLPKSPSGGDLWHNSVTINLNGHTLTVTGARQHNLGSLVINGGGGRIDLSKTNYNDPVFNFDSNSGGGTFAITDTRIDNVYAEQLFYVNECSDTISSINITNCFFNECSFSQEGGVLCFYDDEIKTINITNSNFRNISCSDYASVVFVGNRQLQNLNIKGCEFFKCYSTYEGGVIYIDQNNVYIGNNSSASFDKNFIAYCNASSSYGGGIYSNGRYSTIENFTFFNNSAKRGGAVYAEWNNLIIRRCSFYDNNASEYGGSVYINDDSSRIENTTIAWSVAGESSGIDIYCNSSNYCQCENNTFYFSGTSSFYNCNISNEQKTPFDKVRFADQRNYSGENLVRGTSQNNPIYISTTDDLYALYINMEHRDFNLFGNRHYLLTNPLHGFPGFYNNFKNCTGTFNFGGNFLESTVNWLVPERCIDFYLLDISDKAVHKDGHIEVLINDVYEYCKPVCSLNIDFTTLKSGKYWFYQNINFEDRLKIDGDVTMFLNDGVIVNCDTGVNITSGNKLKIIGKNPNNKGVLNANSTNYEGAGIGGGYGCTEEDTSNNIPKFSGETMGDVTIQNMIVTAIGSKGAGIGGGAGMDGRITGSVAAQTAKPGGGGGKLTIQNSEITAVGDDARDIGGGNGGDGANIPSNGGNGTEITMISGTITATTNGIGGGHAGLKGSSGDGSSTGFGTKNGGDGGSITFQNGKIVTNGLCGGKGVPGEGVDGSPTLLTIPDNYGVSYGKELSNMTKGEKYNVGLNNYFIDNYVKISLLVEYNFNLYTHKCEAKYTLDGVVHSETVDTTHIVTQVATCTENEIAYERAIFTDENIETAYSEPLPVDGTALGHNYGGDVEYVPDFEIGKVTATWKCQHKRCDSVQSETVALTYVVDTKPTCTTNEKGHLEGTFSKGMPTYKTEPNSTEKEDTYLGHKINGQVTYTWNGAECTASGFCTQCNQTVSEKAIGTFVQDTPENCVDDEKGHYHVDFKYNFPSTDSPKNMTIGPTKAYGHNFNGKVFYEWDEEFYCTATVMCINKDCDEIFSEKVKGRFVADTDPTCLDNAIGHYVAEFTQLPGIFKTQVTEFNDVEGPDTALGHNFEGKIYYYWNTETNECTASWYCSRCNEVESETVTGTFIQDTPATCDENAKGHCVAIFANENFNTGQATEPNSVEIPNTALGHQFGGPVTYEWDEQTLQWTAHQNCQREGCDDGVLSETCDGVFVQTEAPTCLDDAKGYYVSDFKTQGFENQTTEKTDYSNPGSALGHQFGGEVTYSWNDDTHECTAIWGCIHDGCHATQSETVQGQYVADTDATCLENEKGHFVADFETEGFVTQYTESNSYERPLSALGHEYGGDITYTWNEETHECLATWGCTHGGCGETQSEVVQGIYVKDTNATCLENEKGHYVATFNISGFGSASTEINSEEIPNTALGHEWGKNIVYSWNNLTHECTALMKCGHAGCTETQIEVVQGIYVKDSDATCLENEKGHYEATFTNPYFTKQNSEQFEINETALGHDIRISYKWNDDYTECIATAECSRGDHIETMKGTITYDYGYAIAKFKDSKFKTQSIKMPTAAQSKSSSEKNESKVNYIFAASCGGVALLVAFGIFICIKRRIF